MAVAHFLGANITPAIAVVAAGAEMNKLVAIFGRIFCTGWEMIIIHLQIPAAEPFAYRTLFGYSMRRLPMSPVNESIGVSMIEINRSFIHDFP